MSGTRGRRIRKALLPGLLVAGVAAGCQPALQQEVGIVYSVDSPALGRVDSFELLTPQGEILSFDTTSLRFRAEFPAAHLSEHQILGDPIEVTFRTEGERRVVTRLDDE